MQKSQQTLLASEGLESQAGDVLLLPIALLAFWHLAYDFVLVVRWPAATITWFFLVIVVSGFLLLRRLWKQTNAIPGKYYRFHVSHVLLLVLGIAYASTALFVRRPNQDDVFYFHRALYQLSALNQPIFLRQTGVDMDAAALLPVHRPYSCRVFAPHCSLLVRSKIRIGSLGGSDRGVTRHSISACRRPVAARSVA